VIFVLASKARELSQTRRASVPRQWRRITSQTPRHRRDTLWLKTSNAANPSTSLRSAACPGFANAPRQSACQNRGRDASFGLGEALEADLLGDRREDRRGASTAWSPRNDLGWRLMREH